METSSSSSQVVTGWRRAFTALTFAASLFCTVHPTYLLPAAIRRIANVPTSNTPVTGPRKFFVGVGRTVCEARLDLSTGPPLGVLFLLATTAVTPGDVRRGLLGSEGIWPFDVLVLVFSLAYISISIDLTGLYAFVAGKVVNSCRGRSGRLLFGVYAFSWILGLISGNDVVVLTMTPICVYFSQRIKADPLPYLIAEFFAANNASLVLVIGNPTNVIVALANNINFLAYTAIFILPSVAACIVTYGALRIVFASRLSISGPPCATSEEPKLDHPRAAVCKCFTLLLCILALAATNIASHGAIEVWVVTVPFAAVLFLADVATDILHHMRGSRRTADLLEKTATDLDCIGAGTTEKAHVELKEEEVTAVPKPGRPALQSQLISYVTSDSAGADGTPLYSVPEYSSRDLFATAGSQHSSSSFPESTTRRRSSLSHMSRLADARSMFPTVGTALKRMPWSLVPFSLSMFVFVEALHVQGWTFALAKLLAPACSNVWNSIFVMGAVTVLGCQLANNLPATIFLTRVVKSVNFAVPLDAKQGALFALAYGSNVGANMLVHASLAGLMWMDVLRKMDCPMSNWTFTKWNAAVFPAALLPGLVVLACQLTLGGFGQLLDS